MYGTTVFDVRIRRVRLSALTRDGRCEMWFFAAILTTSELENVHAGRHKACLETRLRER